MSSFIRVILADDLAIGVRNVHTRTSKKRTLPRGSGNSRGRIPMIARGLLVSLLALPAVAQRGPCTAEFVKAQAATEHPASVADAYFFSGALDKPVIGRAAAQKAFAPIGAEREDEKLQPLRPDRIVS